MRDLRGRVCILTGASRGVGAALAPHLAAAGLKLALVARDQAGLQAVAAQIQGQGGVAKPFPADLSQIDSLPVLVARVAEDLGPPVVLVNNAGVEDFQHFDQATVTGIARSITINLAAPLALTRLLVPYMQAAGQGQVVTMASTAGLVGTPYAAVYSATKAGLIAATHSLRMEYCDAPFGFTAICPGFINGAGMHEVHKREAGHAPAALGGTTVAAVVAAILRALHDDRGEIIVNSTPLRPLIGLGRTLPALSDWLTRRLSGTYMRQLADVRRVKATGPLSQGSEGAKGHLPG
ncbi:MAG: SDR family NAD(P)-dependent oxidoreductase [Oligoflexia bacterium]|nr:SDR family NAD(P)-dependent oxidoreductase [Oligoflexia bacterium]